MKMELIEGSETSAFRTQPLGNYPKENILQYKTCLKIILTNWSGANITWTQPTCCYTSSFKLPFCTSTIPICHLGTKKKGGCKTNTEFPLSWQNLHFLPCHLWPPTHKPSMHRHTCIGAIAEDAGSRCDRIVLTVFLSACWACFDSSVCVTSEWDLTCPRGDPEAAARLWDASTISGLWLDVSSWPAVEGNCHVISDGYKVYFITYKMSVPAPQRIVCNHYEAL